jgi:hypothetical protein
MTNRKLSTFAPFLLIDGVLVFALVMLLQLDWIVNNTLYRYDLRFSLDWAMPYWTALRTSLILLVLAIVAVNAIGYYSYRKTGRESENVVFVCKSCGKAWKELEEIVETEGKAPIVIKILQTCPSCGKKLSEAQDKQVVQDYDVKTRVETPVSNTKK